MAHFKRRTPSRNRTSMRRLKRPVRHRLRRLRNASDARLDGLRDALRQGHCDGSKGLAR